LSLRSVALAVVSLSSLCAVAMGQSVQRNISYTTDAAGSQSGDFYPAAGAGTHPVIVYIHGGSWRSGSSKDFARLATDLAAQGYAGFSINYDLKATSYPISLHESEAAVRFLREHAAEYHLDPARVVVAGASAGGELSALLALAPANHLAAAIELNAVYDLTGNYGVIHRYLGGKCPPQNVCLEASPMEHIHAGAPPFFVGHGTSDHTVPFASAELFTKDMKADGNDVTFFTAQGGPHMYFQKSKFYAANLAAVEAFLAKTVATSQP
jgi:acetyl esterase/lipase